MNLLGMSCTHIHINDSELSWILGDELKKKKKGQKSIKVPSIGFVNEQRRRVICIQFAASPRESRFRKKKTTKKHKGEKQ
jgi:hypothetical protein